MAALYDYKSEDIYFHHSLDIKPRSDEFIMHTHIMCEIYYFISGKGSYRVEGSLYPLRPGSLIVMRPAEAHHLNISPDFPYERMALHIFPYTLHDIDPKGLLFEPFSARDVGQLNLYRTEDFQDGKYSQCLLSMCKGGTSETERRLQIMVNVPPLLNEIRTAFLQKKPEPWNPDLNDIVRNLVMYINNNLYADLSIERISKQFSFSKAYLNRIFRKAMGQSLWRYVIIKRLLDARQRIQNGEPATSVNQRFANWDYSAFYRSYKRYFSFSPQEDANQFRVLSASSRNHFELLP